MLTRTFEWYQVVNASPASEIIDARKASVNSLVAEILRQEDYELLIQCVAAAVSGLEHGFDKQTPIVPLVVQSIREHQSAFPEDLSDNALELRICCALAVGEILVQSTDDADGQDAGMAASLIISALAVRPMPQERFLKRMLEELRDLAYSILANQAHAKRERTALGAAAEALDQVPEQAALPAFWKDLQETLKRVLGEVERQAAVDREELDVLWWMFTGHSSAAGKVIADLEPAAAAVCCGCELANLVVVPPVPSTGEMMHRALATGRNATALIAQPLSQLVKAWDGPLVSLLIPDDDKLANAVKSYPFLFPLSWLCQRLRESGFADGWDQEFRARTGLCANDAISPADLARQVFNERVAQRVFAN